MLGIPMPLACATATASASAGEAMFACDWGREVGVDGRAGCWPSWKGVRDVTWRCGRPESRLVALASRKNGGFLPWCFAWDCKWERFQGRREMPDNSALCTVRPLHSALSSEKGHPGLELIFGASLFWAIHSDRKNLLFRPNF